MQPVDLESREAPRYYHALNRGSDFLVRCKDCKRLVTRAEIATYGSCPGDEVRACGNRRFTEVTMLNDAERDAIVAGVIDFPYRAEFLAEFAPHG